MVYLCLLWSSSLLLTWLRNCRAGTVESRLRQLVMKLEYVDSLTLAHPFTKGFDLVSYCKDEDEIRAVAQGEDRESINKRKKEDIEGIEGASTVYSSTFYIGLGITPKARMFSLLSIYGCLDPDVY